MLHALAFGFCVGVVYALLGRIELWVRREWRKRQARRTAQ